MAEQNNNVNTENDNNDENEQISNEIDNDNIENGEYDNTDNNTNSVIDASDIVNGDNVNGDDEWYDDDDDNDDNNDNGEYSQRPVGYDFDDIDGDENDNVLDQEAMTSFIQQLFTLQKKNLQKKRESRLIPSLNKFLKYDIDEKGSNITPQMVSNLLHICELIYTNKIEHTLVI